MVYVPTVPSGRKQCKSLLEVSLLIVKFSITHPVVKSLVTRRRIAHHYGLSFLVAKNALAFGSSLYQVLALGTFSFTILWACADTLCTCWTSALHSCVCALALNMYLHQCVDCCSWFGFIGGIRDKFTAHLLRCSKQCIHHSHFWHGYVFMFENTIYSTLTDLVSST